MCIKFNSVLQGLRYMTPTVMLSLTHAIYERHYQMKCTCIPP